MASKAEWVAYVASHCAGDLWASEPTQIVGEYDSLSDAEQERIGAAIDEVRNRLYRMGKGGKQ